MTAIFISHSSVDHVAAAAMKSWLEQQGHTSLFLDFDPGVGIVAGSDWEETLYFKLRQCHAVIALLTTNWLASKWCFAEVVQAREKGKPVFPVKVAPCESAAVLSDVQHIDLTANPDEAYARLMVGLRQHGLDPLDVFDWQPDRSPYPGLLSFQEEDAAVYFGRRADILNGLETLNALRRQGRGAPRLVLFLGASGSGKSSLVRAELIPRLKKAPSEWLPLSPFRPQDDPLRELAITLADGFGTHGRPRDYGEIAQVLASAAERTPADGGALLSLIRDIAIAAGRRDAAVVLAIDQAEEFFGYGAAGPADRFMRLLRAALEASDRQLIAVATLRSDFLGEFQSVRALQDAEYDHHLAYRVVPVDAIAERSFAEIIQGPARVAGLRLEDGLVDVMVGDTGTRDALPLLAFTLRRLWERRDQDGVLRRRHYDEIGRLEGAIRLEADRVLADAGPSGEELEALRAAFVPAMVRINVEGGYARRPTKVDDLPRPALHLLQRFVDARLLVSDRNTDGSETLEVAHEALLRTWPQLAHWLAEDQDRLRLLESVRRAAEEWIGSGSEDDLLVHRDGRLHEALGLTANPRFALQAASVEKRYLDACLAAQLVSEAAKREEQERRIRDAERIAEEQKKAAAAQRKTARRTLAGLAAALILAAVAAIAAMQAIRNSWEANRQRTIAQDNAGQLALSNTQLEAEKTRAEAAATRAEIALNRMALYFDKLAGLSEELNAPQVEDIERRISPMAIAMIERFEILDKETYERLAEKPNLFSSSLAGVSIGFGYDLGYITVEEFRKDWGELLIDEDIARLSKAIGLKGAEAKAMMPSLADIVIPYKAARLVHLISLLPKYFSIAENALPNFGELPPKCAGSLVSLIFNRGANFRSPEMKRVYNSMKTRDFKQIPQEIREMASKFPGLNVRRKMEASLFEQCLSEAPSLGR